MGGRVPAQDYYWFGWSDSPTNMMCNPVKDGILKEDRCKQEKKCIICYAVSTMRSMAQDYKAQDKTLDMLCEKVMKAKIPDLPNTEEDVKTQEHRFIKSLWQMYTAKDNAEFRKSISKWGAVRIKVAELPKAYHEGTIMDMNVHLTALGSWQDMKNMRFLAGRDMGNEFYKRYANQKENMLEMYGLNKKDKVGDVVEATLGTRFFVKIAEHHLKAARTGEEVPIHMLKLEYFLKNKDWESFREMLEKDLHEYEDYFHNHQVDIQEKDHDEEMKDLELASASGAAIGSTGRLSMGGASDVTEEPLPGAEDDMGPASMGTRPKQRSADDGQDTEVAQEDEEEKKDDAEKDDKANISSSEEEDSGTEEDSEEEEKVKDKAVDEEKDKEEKKNTDKHGDDKDKMVKELHKKMEHVENTLEKLQKSCDRLQKEKEDALKEKDKYYRKSQKMETNLGKLKEKLQNKEAAEEDAYRKYKNTEEIHEALKRAHDELRKDAMKDNEELKELRKKMTEKDMMNMKDATEEAKKRTRSTRRSRGTSRNYKTEYSMAAKKYKYSVQTRLNQTLTYTMQFMYNNQIPITAEKPTEVAPLTYMTTAQTGQGQGSAGSGQEKPRTIPPPRSEKCILDNYAYPMAALTLTSKDKEMTWKMYYNIGNNEDKEKAGDALIKQNMFKWENTWYNTWVVEEDIAYDKEPEWDEYKKKTALMARYPNMDYNRDNPKIRNCNASQKIREYITGKKQDPLGDMYKRWVPWGQIYEWWQLHAGKDDTQSRIAEGNLLLIMAKACDRAGKGICFCPGARRTTCSTCGPLGRHGMGENSRCSGSTTTANSCGRRSRWRTIRTARI